MTIALPTMAAVEPAAVRVTTILRLEAGLALAGAVLAYRAIGGSWVLFAALFLVPDLGMLGYLRGRGTGAALYNATHTMLAPGLLAAAGALAGAPICIQLALIWASHIAFDRALGFGLKYTAGFGVTHLGHRDVPGGGPA